MLNEFRKGEKGDMIFFFLITYVITKYVKSVNRILQLACVKLIYDSLDKVSVCIFLVYLFFSLLRRLSATEG